MDIVVSSQKPAGARADLVVVAANRLDDPDLADVNRRCGGHLARFLRRRGFKGDGGASLIYQSPPQSIGAEFVLVVPRQADPVRAARITADVAIAKARELRLQTVGIATGSTLPLETLAETLDLAAYQFRGFKGSPRRPPTPPGRIVLLGSASRAADAAVARGRTLAAATCLARDLTNTPADTVTPTFLAHLAVKIARDQRLVARVLGPAQMKRLGMGALLAVARGSVQPARFIELIYRPPRAKARIALIGKGITFDSGGLSLKSSESMQTQKRDMAGGAVVLGVMSAVRSLRIAVEVRGYVPTTENMPSGAALKPGDVVRALNGTTIEVLNTDAEGRLVLADALAYAARRKPDLLIDFATLTAAVRTTLGPRYAAVLSSDPELARTLIASAAAEGENLWELPLVDEYRRDLDSMVADLKNTGEGHSGTIIGGLFLREFTAGLPWAHVDFSSTVVTDKPFPGHPRGASGFGVRTALRYLLDL